MSSPGPLVPDDQAAPDPGSSKVYASGPAASGLTSAWSDSPPKITFPPHPQFTEAFADQVAAVFRPLTIALTGAAEQIAAAFRPLTQAGHAWAAAVLHEADKQKRPRWHRRKCRTCNPAGFTDPLPYGREYHRRQLARRRRGRKRRR